jgi:hypothetical protein
VREPGTAERASVCLRPDGDRRMPGTRSSFSWRQALPLRPPLRASSFSETRVHGCPRSRVSGPQFWSCGGVTTELRTWHPCGTYVTDSHPYESYDTII